jgi:hypothetical protein
MKPTNPTLYCDGKLRAVVYTYDGKCRKCGSKVRFKTIRPNDSICIECETGIYKFRSML